MNRPPGHPPPQATLATITLTLERVASQVNEMYEEREKLSGLVLEHEARLQAHDRQHDRHVVRLAEHDQRFETVEQRIARLGGPTPPHGMRRHGELVQPPPLPPMRDELPSSHTIAERVGKNTADSFAKLARDTSTPPPDAKDVQKLVTEGVQTELLKIRAAALQKAADEREAATAKKAEDDRLLAIDRAKARTKLIAALGAALLAVAGLLTDLAVHWAKP
jgi:hypothetical protein